jgi:uncharacterized protein
MQNRAQPAPAEAPPPAWWRHGHLWLVIAGPAIVVVACIVTAVIAARGADTLLPQGAARQGVRIDAQSVTERARMPALVGRNHAATPVARP